MYLVQYSKDKKWYRAVVKKLFSDGDKCIVFYLDYGNSDEVSMTQYVLSNLSNTTKWNNKTWFLMQPF